jgi:hypothetical protein
MSKTNMTMVELPTVSEKGKITIKPFFDPNVDNLGLQNYGIALFDGVFHEEQLACVENNGIIRYITGLNPFAPDVKLIQDPEKREARINEINKVVAKLEAELATNILDPKDPDFWNKVKLLSPSNEAFWSKITVRCGNQPVPLDPEANSYDLIKLYAIEAGGFSIVAKSYEDARSRAVSPKFYLDKAVTTIATKTEVKKLRNKALSELEAIFKKNPSKLMYIAKVVDGNSAQYKKSTPMDVIYDNMDKYITGEGVETNLRRAAETFLEACEQDVESLKLRALVKDANFYKLIATKSDGMIYHMASQSMMGRNTSECIEYLKNPLNDKILGELLTRIETYWKK